MCPRTCQTSSMHENSYLIGGGQVLFGGHFLWCDEGLGQLYFHFQHGVGLHVVATGQGAVNCQWGWLYRAVGT